MNCRALLDSTKPEQGFVQTNDSGYNTPLMYIDTNRRPFARVAHPVWLVDDGVVPARAHAAWRSAVSPSPAPARKRQANAEDGTEPVLKCIVCTPEIMNNLATLGSPRAAFSAARVSPSPRSHPGTRLFFDSSRPTT